MEYFELLIVLLADQKQEMLAVFLGLVIKYASDIFSLSFKL